VHKRSRAILQRLAKDFKEKHHGLVRELRDYQVPVLSLADLSPKGLSDAKTEGPSLVDLLLDLKQHGYIVSPDSSYISLTEKGLSEGLRGGGRRAWEFINKSPGLAVLISFTSLVVAILSLVLAYSKRHS
jgi:hypothetical protein